MSAGINNSRSLLIILISLLSWFWTTVLALLNSILRTRSYRSSSNALRCSFFGDVKTDSNPKLLTAFTSSILFGFSRTLNFPSRYGNWKRKIRIILLIGILLRKLRNIFVDIETVIYVFVRSSLLQEQVLMFCSINVMTLSQNAGI